VSDSTHINKKLITILKKFNLSISTAESCTGGLISKKITDIDGSSAVFWGSFITYSEDAKVKLLSVNKDLLKSYGAVSKEVVESMASGAILRSGTFCSLSVSGIAGPGGGSKEKPVGTVWICAALNPDIRKTQKFSFSGNREEVREKAAESALLMVYNLILNKTTIDS